MTSITYTHHGGHFDFVPHAFGNLTKNGCLRMKNLVSGEGSYNESVIAAYPGLNNTGPVASTCVAATKAHNTIRIRADTVITGSHHLLR